MQRLLQERKALKETLNTLLASADRERAEREAALKQLRAEELEAQRQLDAAGTELDSACTDVKGITPKQLDEIRGMRNPPSAVKITCQCVHLLLGGGSGKNALAVSAASWEKDLVPMLAATKPTFAETVLSFQPKSIDDYPESVIRFLRSTLSSPTDARGDVGDAGVEDVVGDTGMVDSAQKGVPASAAEATPGSPGLGLSAGNAHSFSTGNMAAGPGLRAAMSLKRAGVSETGGGLRKAQSRARTPLGG